MKKNLFLTFCFSFIPGAGQMYQDYMKRGLSIMILFAASIALFGVTSIPVLAAPIPVILAYSFFDTYSIRNKIGTEKQVEDQYIWNDEILKDINLKSKFKNNTIATILIFVGVYILLNNVILSIAYKFEITFLYNIMKILTNYLPSIIIAIISILIGIRFISKK